ncbi:MAG: hypothetical protein ACRENY_04055 [Candidatus Dormibacteria bacterium]
MSQVPLTDPASESNLNHGTLFRLVGRIHTTPLLHSRLLDQRLGARLWLKAEYFQRAGSFKAPGGLQRGPGRPGGW